MANFSTQTGNITDVTVTENSGVSNVTQTFGEIPAEHQAAVEAINRKLQEEVKKPEANPQSILKIIMEFAWENGPAFLAFAKMWFLK